MHRERRNLRPPAPRPRTEEILVVSVLDVAEEHGESDAAGARWIVRIAREGEVAKVVDYVVDVRFPPIDGSHDGAPELSPDALLGLLRGHRAGGSGGADPRLRVRLARRARPTKQLCVLCALCVSFNGRRIRLPRTPSGEKGLRELRVRFNLRGLRVRRCDVRVQERIHEHGGDGSDAGDAGEAEAAVPVPACADGRHPDPEREDERHGHRPGRGAAGVERDADERRGREGGEEEERGVGRGEDGLERDAERGAEHPERHEEPDAARDGERERALAHRGEDAAHLVAEDLDVGLRRGDDEADDECRAEQQREAPLRGERGAAALAHRADAEVDAEEEDREAEDEQRAADEEAPEPPRPARARRHGEEPEREHEPHHRQDRQRGLPELLQQVHGARFYPNAAPASSAPARLRGEGGLLGRAESERRRERGAPVGVRLEKVNIRAAGFVQWNTRAGNFRFSREGGNLRPFPLESSPASRDASPFHPLRPLPTLPTLSTLSTLSTLNFKLYPFLLTLR